MNLDHLPRRFRSLTHRDRLLYFAPHPDDEALAGGLLLQRAAQAGTTVQVIFATDGENNPWPQRAAARRWRLDETSQHDWRLQRRNEAIRSLQHLGFGAEQADHWRLPDLGITSLLMDGADELLTRLERLIDAFDPTLIVLPSIHDLHPDHSALALLVRVALRRRLAHPRFDGADLEILEYLVHYDHTPPGGVVLAAETAEIRTKRAAILSHQTQMLLSRRRFLRYAAPEETFWPVTIRTSFSGPAAASIRSLALRLPLRRSYFPLPRTILIAGLNRARNLAIYHLKIPRRSSLGTLHRDGRLVQSPVVQTSGHLLRVGLQLDEPLCDQPVFAKETGRHWNFDLSGWVPLAGRLPALQPTEKDPIRQTSIIS